MLCLVFSLAYYFSWLCFLVKKKGTIGNMLYSGIRPEVIFRSDFFIYS